MRGLGLSRPRSGARRLPGPSPQASAGPACPVRRAVLGDCRGRPPRGRHANDFWHAARLARITGPRKA